MEKFSKLVLVFLIIGILCLFMKGYFSIKEIYENSGQTICKYTFCKQFPKTNVAYVKYYIGNKLYRNKAGRCPKNYKTTIDKYFVLNYSTIDPDNIHVDFSKEVKDSVLIKELESKL